MTMENFMLNARMFSNSPSPKEYSASTNIKSPDISDPAPYGTGVDIDGCITALTSQLIDQHVTKKKLEP